MAVGVAWEREETLMSVEQACSPKIPSDQPRILAVLFSATDVPCPQSVAMGQKLNVRECSIVKW